MAKTSIYHNPRCSKSRQALALLRDNDIEPEVIEYLKQPPNQTQLKQILKLLNCEPRDIMRQSEDIFKKLKIASTEYSQAELIKLMVEHPILIERPIIVHGKKAVVGRPPENVLSII